MKAITRKLGQLGVATGTVAAGLVGMASMALAADPVKWQLGLSEPVDPAAVDQIWFHDDILMPLITAISVFVLVLLIWVCIRFNSKANPTPSKTTHHVLLEVAWTMLPILILAALAFPSLRLLYKSDDVSEADMTIKIIGHQWYWEYEYPDDGGFAFDSFIEARTFEEAEEKGVKRLMDVDNAMVVPTGKNVRLVMTSADVIHNWAVSELGVRMDTVPGRLNEEGFIIPEGKEGIYYGFCSELCGKDHAFMPIAVKAVTQAEYAQWVKQAQAEYAALDINNEQPASKLAELD
ncbi:MULTISPECIES: cytochrome c oxidase subunit II [Curvivirga]|uniref:cytochrome c oxidase subunit II n=1 Tax=Curvivirga TaxID=2856846 RepID=UPI0012BB5452|nr:cytochrome c oxidase subunit II [Curvivirga aplysinae]MTI11335.1 cytochrome c oxidase subunit II [Curvivirga aplysinae]